MRPPPVGPNIALRDHRAVSRLPRIVDFSDKPPTLRCRGDEDRATQGGRRPALARAFSAEADVIVDLTELTFADTSLMVDLAMLSRRLRGRGRALMLRGAQPHIQRMIEVVGLDRLPGVRSESLA